MSYFILLYAVSIALGYELRFTEATLRLGRALAKTQQGQGYQNAITPPASSIIGMVIYVLSITVLGWGFYAYGVPAGFAVALGFILMVILNRMLLLPNPESEHFRKIIIDSMVRRHADYVRKGDQSRASVIAELLEKAGVPLNELPHELQK